MVVRLHRGHCSISHHGSGFALWIYQWYVRCYETYKLVELDIQPFTIQLTVGTYFQWHPIALSICSFGGIPLTIHFAKKRKLHYHMYLAFATAMSMGVGFYVAITNKYIVGRPHLTSKLDVGGLYARFGFLCISV